MIFDTPGTRCFRRVVLIMEKKMKMELQIAICDDEKIWADELAEQIREYGREHDIIFHIHEFSCGSDLMEPQEKFDIIILDIRLRGENGIFLAEQIREQRMVAEFMFYSAYPEFATEGYHVNASGFLIKGEPKEQFERKFGYVLEHCEDKNFKIELKTAHGSVFRNISNLLYIKYGNRELEYYWKDGTKILAKDTLKHLDKLIKSKKLFQISKTVVVNPRFIEWCFSYEIKLFDTGEIFRVSRRRWREVEQDYLNYNRRYIR